MADAERDAFFYRTHAGAELDLLLVRNGKRYRFECKYEDAPRSTKSMHVVSNDLKLVKLWVVYPGGQTSPLREGMEVVPFKNMQTVLRENDLM
jgi:predicted AAA+ superfamily ATPase